jgi:rubrerythrin
MSTNQSLANPVIDPAAFNRHAEKLRDDFNLFCCNKCGHYAGDPRPNNFRARCPGCNLQAKFYRIIA